MAWAEAVAEALAHAPDRAEPVLRQARAGAPWRLALGLSEPSPRLSEAIDAMGRAVREATPPGDPPTSDAVLKAVDEDRPGNRGSTA
jgi:hypothetical protein